MQPTIVKVSDEPDAVLSALALHARIGRGRLLEIAIQRLAEEFANGHGEVLAMVARAADARNKFDVHMDEIDLDLIAHPPPAVSPY